MPADLAAGDKVPFAASRGFALNRRVSEPEQVRHKGAGIPPINVRDRRSVKWSHGPGGGGDVALFLMIGLILLACLLVPALVLMRRERRTRGADTWHEPERPASRRPWPGQQRVGDDPRR